MMASLTRWQLWFLGSLLFLGLSCRRVPVGGQVTLAGEPTPGVVTVHVVGKGANVRDMEQNAIRQALETVLFVGLPSAQTQTYRLPLTERTTDAIAFLSQFVNQQDYQPFIMAIARDQSIRRRTTGGQTSQPFTITLNYDALRRQTEQAGLVRKFGY